MRAEEGGWPLVTGLDLEEITGCISPQNHRTDLTSEAVIIRVQPAAAGRSGAGGSAD